MTKNKRYIIEKYSSDIYSKYNTYSNNQNRYYDDYYILHSLKNIVKKINILKKENNNIEVLLVSMNSGTSSQLDKGKYKYIKIEFDKNLGYKEKYYDYTYDIYFFLDEEKICFFEIGVFLELYNNLKSYEQFSYTYIYEIINKIISPYKLIYDNYRFLNNKEKNYKDIIKDIKNNHFELIIKEREIDRLKKVMQEYFDDNNKKAANSILPSYRLNKKDKKKDTRYYTLESLIVLDEILRIYKSIKSTEFVFIRNISYLDDTEEIAKEIFNFDKILKSNIYTIEGAKYIKEIILNISDDEERQKEIKKIDIKDIFNNFETIQMKDLENTIFYLYDTILSLIKDIRDNKNYNNIIEENEELQKGILYYDSVFYYLRYFIGYLFTDKQIINEEEYVKIIGLYIYKYNTLRSHNIYRFYKFYLNNETAKKYNIKDYGTINYNLYYYRDEEKIIKRYSIYDYKEICIYYYKFILMSIAYNIVGYHRDEEYYIESRREIKEEREKNPYDINFGIIYKEEFEKIKDDINKFNRMLNNLYFINIIDYEEYKKYNCFKLEELINYICGLIEDEEKFINIKENIKEFEVYQSIKKEITKIKSTVSEFEKVIEYLYDINIINDKNFKSANNVKVINLLNFTFYQIKDKFDDAEENIKQFKVYKLIKKEIELNNNKIILNNKLEYIHNSDNLLNKLFYSFLEKEYKLSYDNTEEIIKKINNFYDIYKQIEIPIKK